MPQATTGIQVSDDLSLPEKVIELVNISNAALEKAAAAQTKTAEAQTKTASLIPKVVDTMVQFNRINPDQREKLAKALTDPVQVLELLIKVAGHRNADEIACLGAPVGGTTKTAAAAPRETPFVGGRNSGIRESDRRLFAGLGLPAPTGA